MTRDRQPEGNVHTQSRGGMQRDVMSCVKQNAAAPTAAELRLVRLLYLRLGVRPASSQSVLYADIIELLPVMKSELVFVPEYSPFTNT